MRGRLVLVVRRSGQPARATPTRTTLIVLGVIGITVKTAVSVASGSTFVYLRATGARVAGGRLRLPARSRWGGRWSRHSLRVLAADPEMLAHRGDQVAASTHVPLGSGELAVGAATLTLLVVLPLPAFVAIKQPVAWTITGLTIAITIDRSVRTTACRVARRQLLMLRLRYRVQRLCEQDPSMIAATPAPGCGCERGTQRGDSSPPNASSRLPRRQACCE